MGRTVWSSAARNRTKPMLICMSVRASHHINGPSPSWLTWASRAEGCSSGSHPFLFLPSAWPRSQGDRSVRRRMNRTHQHHPPSDPCLSPSPCPCSPHSCSWTLSALSCHFHSLSSLCPILLRSACSPARHRPVLARWRGCRLGSETVRSREQHRAVRPSRRHTVQGRLREMVPQAQIRISRSGLL
jgi:hypothetical protein